MLFLLTGNVQTGKTRWLERLVSDLAQTGIASYGVIAPGIWHDWRGEENPPDSVDGNGFEKIGIDNVLLPSGKRLTFALRADLAVKSHAFDPNSQSARANLHWHIDDKAIADVNDHFSKLMVELASSTSPGILIVDELGQLELQHGSGLTGAIDTLEAGAFPSVKHALVVVRESLMPLAAERFGNWGGTTVVFPDAPSRAIVLTAAKSTSQD